MTSKPDDDCFKYIAAVNSKMTLNTIDKEYVLDAIGLLKNGKGSGPGKDIHKSDKRCCEIYCPPITCIFNSSITNGVSPYA